MSMVKLNKEVVGPLKDVWVSNTTEPFPAYGGHAGSFVVKGVSGYVILMAATEADVRTAFKALAPERDEKAEKVNPVILTHMNNVKLIDDEL